VRVEVYLPLLISAVLDRLAPWLARHLPPASASRLLAVAGVLCGASTVLELALLAWSSVVEIPQVAALGHWSIPLWERDDPVPDAVGGVAGVALVVLAIRLVHNVRSRYRAARAVRGFVRGQGPAPGGLILVDDPTPLAFAVPFDQGRIVVSTGMLRALTVQEQRALFAHERAHLRFRHHTYRTIVETAAAADPPLRRLPAAIRYATERWADEVAADTVGDRRLAARALTRAALARGSRESSGPELGYGSRDVSDRVRHLLGPRPRQNPLALAAIVILVAATLISAVDAGSDIDRLLDKATAQPHH
jgi:Zn-dependent protease with chaperone function